MQIEICPSKPHDKKDHRKKKNDKLPDADGGSYCITGLELLHVNILRVLLNIIK